MSEIGRQYLTIIAGDVEYHLTLREHPPEEVTKLMDASHHIDINHIAEKQIQDLVNYLTKHNLLTPEDLAGFHVKKLAPEQDPMRRLFDDQFPSR